MIYISKWSGAENGIFGLHENHGIVRTHEPLQEWISPWSSPQAN